MDQKNHENECNISRAAPFIEVPGGHFGPDAHPSPPDTMIDRQDTAEFLVEIALDRHLPFAVRSRAARLLGRLCGRHELAIPSKDWAEIATL